jgi:hypothetical protein
MFVSHHQNAGRHHKLLILNKSFENVAEFKYLGTPVTNQNDIHEEIKSKLNLWNACYHFVQGLSSSHLLSETKIKRYKTIILSIVLYGCETGCLTLREEHRLRTSENRVLRRISGPKREEVAGGWSRLHNEELHNFYTSINIMRKIK